MRRLAIAVVASACVLGLVLFWVWAPYLDGAYVRVSKEPIELVAIYSNETSDPLCSKLYEGVDGRKSDVAVFARVAADLPDPNASTDLSDGDEVTLRGYRYEWSETNSLTGETSTRPSGRVDVVAWVGPNGERLTSKLDPNDPESFSTENYVGCR